MMDRHARFNVVWEETDGHRLTIRDMGPWSRYFTITNDAEYIVKYLHDLGVLWNNRRLLYYDSDGMLTELQYEGDTFKGFAPAPLKEGDDKQP